MASLYKSPQLIKKDKNDTTVTFCKSHQCDGAGRWVPSSAALVKWMLTRCWPDTTCLPVDGHSITSGTCLPKKENPNLRKPRGLPSQFTRNAGQRGHLCFELILYRTNSGNKTDIESVNEHISIVPNKPRFFQKFHTKAQKCLPSSNFYLRKGLIWAAKETFLKKRLALNMMPIISLDILSSYLALGFVE